MSEVTSHMYPKNENSSWELPDSELIFKLMELIKKDTL